MFLTFHYQIRSQVGLFPSHQISFVLFSVARWLDHFPVPWPSVSPEGRLHAVARLLRPPHLRVGMHHRAPRNHGENHLGIVIITSLNFEMIRPVLPVSTKDSRDQKDQLRKMDLKIFNFKAIF